MSAKRKGGRRPANDEYEPQKYPAWVRIFVWVFLVIFIFSVAGGILIVGNGH